MTQNILTIILLVIGVSMIIGVPMWLTSRDMRRVKLARSTRVRATGKYLYDENDALADSFGVLANPKEEQILLLLTLKKARERYTAHMVAGQFFLAEKESTTMRLLEQRLSDLEQQIATEKGWGEEE